MGLGWAASPMPDPLVSHPALGPATAETGSDPKIDTRSTDGARRAPFRLYKSIMNSLYHFLLYKRCCQEQQYFVTQFPECGSILHLLNQ